MIEHFELRRAGDRYVGYLCSRHVENRKVLGWVVHRVGRRVPTPHHDNCRDCIAAADRARREREREEAERTVSIPDPRQRRMF